MHGRSCSPCQRNHPPLKPLGCCCCLDIGTVCLQTQRSSKRGSKRGSSGPPRATQPPAWRSRACAAQPPAWRSRARAQDQEHVQQARREGSRGCSCAGVVSCCTVLHCGGAQWCTFVELTMPQACVLWRTNRPAQPCPLWRCSYKRIASDPKINHFFEGKHSLRSGNHGSASNVRSPGGLSGGPAVP